MKLLFTVRPIKELFFEIMALSTATILLLLWLNAQTQKDIINVTLAAHLPVYLTQAIVLVLLFRQILTFRVAKTMTGVRKKNDFIQKKLLTLIVVEVTLYFVIFYSLFLFTGLPVFDEGPAIVGGLLLLMRYITVLTSAIMLIGAYNIEKPALFLVMAEFITIAYHYAAEGMYLLILYSPIYDSLYRAVHMMYQ